MVAQWPSGTSSFLEHPSLFTHTPAQCLSPQDCFRTRPVGTFLRGVKATDPWDQLVSHLYLSTLGSLGAAPPETLELPVLTVKNGVCRAMALVFPTFSSWGGCGGSGCCPEDWRAQRWMKHSQKRRKHEASSRPPPIPGRHLCPLPMTNASCITTCLGL